MKRYSLFFFLLFSLQACDSGKFYKKFEDIPQFQWKRDEPVKFTVDIKDTQADYALIMGFRYVPHLKHSEIKVQLTLSTPGGKTQINEYIVAIEDEKGNQLGEVMGDIADIEKVVEESIRFNEKGKYNFEIKQMMKPEEVGGIMEVGLLLDKKGEK